MFIFGKIIHDNWTLENPPNLGLFIFYNIIDEPIGLWKAFPHYSNINTIHHLLYKGQDCAIVFVNIDFRKWGRIRRNLILV